MLQRRILLALAAPILCAGLLTALQVQGNVEPAALESEPVLVFDVSGSTLLGPVHRHLAVYNSGNVSYATRGPREAVPFVGSTLLDAKRVEALVSGLSAAGAWQGVDQDHAVTDCPLTTVTVLTAATDGRAHSFSYWVATQRTHEAVQDLIDAFVTEVFPSATNPYHARGG